MNIKEAKEQIKNAMTAYFTTDELGEYVIPIEKQRPVFLMGPPGIGKTAIMEQVASELGVGLVSYSMTHHTRQSALGLPFITHKKYGDMECDVSEYTMSEIISSVYDMIEETGISEGILFLDEINCVSETLAPVMLQFLQYKIFGRHRVPDGWIVVTAGNPPEYNNSVREFDIVTWDRLKRIDVEADFDAWKEYARDKAVHPAVLTYLEAKKDDFYKIEMTVDGKSFVTARGWDDLSQMIKLYEQNGIAVDRKLIGQYLQNEAVARNFAVYYDLFRKYQSDYQVENILAGKAEDNIKTRAKEARFDERLALLGLLLDAVLAEMREAMQTENVMKELLSILRMFKETMLASSQEELRGSEPQNGELLEEAQEFLNKQADALRRMLAAGKNSGSISDERRRELRMTIQALSEMSGSAAGKSGSDAFAAVKSIYDSRVQAMKKAAAEAGARLSNVFRFCEEVFIDGQEMVILVTELTISTASVWFISRYGCSEYFAHNKELLFHERRREILREIQELNLD